MSSAWLHEQTLEIVEQLSEAGLTRLDDVEDTIVTVGLLRQIKEAAAQAAAQQERYLTTMLHAGESVQVPGVAQVSLKADPKKRTHGRRLAHVLAAQIADEPHDDPIPPGALAVAVADRLVEVWGLDAPSKTPLSTVLKKYGLKPGDFIDYVDGDPKIAWLEGSS